MTSPPWCVKSSAFPLTSTSEVSCRPRNLYHTSYIHSLHLSPLCCYQVGRKTPALHVTFMTLLRTSYYTDVGVRAFIGGAIVLLCN